MAAASSAVTAASIRLARSDWLAGLDPALAAMAARIGLGEHFRFGDCPSCTVPAHARRIYCAEHRCGAPRWDGAPCRQAADPDRGFAYCAAHGCHHILQRAQPVPGQRGRFSALIYCMSPSQPGDSPYCAVHAIQHTDADAW